MMIELATLHVRHIDSDEEAVTVVRAGRGCVALTVSLEHDGDAEVVFTPEECENLVEALRQAATLARKQD